MWQDTLPNSRIKSLEIKPTMLAELLIF